MPRAVVYNVWFLCGFLVTLCVVTSFSGWLSTTIFPVAGFFGKKTTLKLASVKVAEEAMLFHPQRGIGGFLSSSVPARLHPFFCASFPVLPDPSDLR